MTKKKEINYFEDKFKIKINFIAGSHLIIPEYSINLLDKNKKVIKKIENINKIEGLEEKAKVVEKVKKVSKISKKNKKVVLQKIKKDTSKKDKKKTPRTLWVRRKKKAA